MTMTALGGAQREAEGEMPRAIQQKYGRNRTRLGGEFQLSVALAIGTKHNDE
jgi:hypothetical protein